MCLCCRSSFKCHKITAVSLFIFSVILIVLGIVMPIVLESLLKNMARENVVMTPKTYETWGRVPGDTNMQIVRRFQFFEFYNPYETVFLNKTPIFIETKPYEYQEFQNFTNVTYRNLPDSDVEVIDFNYWEYMHKMEVGNASDKVKLVNLAGFGAWYQLGTAEDYLIAIQAFGQLIGGLEDEIYEFALAQGILGMLLTSKEQALQRFESYGITPDKADLLWEDPQYGWKNATTLHVWVKAAKEGLFKKTANSLQDYFHLVFTKIDALLRSLKNNVDMIETILVNNYCKDKVNVTCDSRYLAALQWAQQGVTKYPPGGVGGSDSIISTNTTADGFPEISFFYKEYFLKKINNSTSYQNIVFDVMWVYNITKRSGDANNWLTDENLVFHQGNMKFLFEQGRKFDKSQNLDDLISIKNRFRLKSLQQTHVFWAYFNYLVTEFAAMTNRNGSKETLGLGALSSQYFYVGFMEIKDFLFRELKREVLLNLMKNNKIGCKDLINNSIIDEVNVTEICLDIQLIKWDLDTMDYLQDICGINQSIWNDFRERHNLTKTNMFELCANSSENIYSFGPMLDLTNTMIKKHYNCIFYENYCSEMELALKQWGQSTITLNPMPILSDKKSVLSLSEWFPDRFEKSLEFLAFLKVSKLDTIDNENLIRSIDRKGINETLSNYLLTFDCLFNAVMNSKAFIYYKNNEIKNFTTDFHYDNPYLLLNYLRYIVFEYAFGGLTITRNVSDVLLGYEVPFLKSMQQQDPALGGNPSIPVKIGLCPNMSYEDAIYHPQTMYTGKGDSDKVRSYYQVDGSRNISQITPDFDGNNSRNISKNPWNKEVPIQGTDGFTGRPNLNPDGDTVYVYVTMLFRWSKATQQHSSRDFNGLKGNLYHMDNSLMNIDPDFNQNKWNGFLNFSSLMSAPVFNSKRHFLDVDENVTNLTKIYREEISESSLITPNADEDNIYLYIEPYTGLSLAAWLKLQTNVELKQNLLFNTDIYAMLPIFSIIRGGDIPDETVDDLLGALKIGILLKDIVLRVICFCLGGIILIISLVLFKQWYNKNKKDEAGEFLLNKMTNI